MKNIRENTNKNEKKKDDYLKITNLEKESIVMKFYRKERDYWIQGKEKRAKIYWRLIYLLFNCSIPPTTDLAESVNIAHGIGIVIHQNSKIGKGTKIYQNVTIGGGDGPVIGSNCVIYAGACILGDIVIGDNCVIGANAVVTKDVPGGATVVGVPGKIIKINGKRV